jgi:3',5'-cyclic-AMP phosphodiesterase
MADNNGHHSRRGVLECMAWAGGAVLWTVAGGVPRGRIVGAAQAAEAAAGFSFMQISDSHIGFKNAPNANTEGTLQEAIALVRAQSAGAGMMIHTGDVSHLSRDAQFDSAEQICKGAGLTTHFVPGEHDVLVDDGANFFQRFTPGSTTGYYSFDQAGIHFIGLNNVQNLKAGGLGFLGPDQIEWLRKDVASRPSSQPIVVFAHVPLWLVSQDWGWGTDDGAQALALLKRFGSVTVLNGHIHQVMQKVEGNVAFHTARSTAFPQPAPGTAPSPGPMKDVPADRLRSMLGVAKIARIQTDSHLAIIDTPLGA